MTKRYSSGMTHGTGILDRIVQDSGHLHKVCYLSVFLTNASLSHILLKRRFRRDLCGIARKADVQRNPFFSQ